MVFKLLFLMQLKLVLKKCPKHQSKLLSNVTIFHCHTGNVSHTFFISWHEGLQLMAALNRDVRRRYNLSLYLTLIGALNCNHAPTESQSSEKGKWF